jgi:hypothetical protein
MDRLAHTRRMRQKWTHSWGAFGLDKTRAKALEKR